MNTLDKIRLSGFEVAAEAGIINGEKLSELPPSSELVDDLVCRVLEDFFEFNTQEQFDAQQSNLFRRAFMYLYGKGAEHAFYARMDFMEYDISRLSYDFNAAMRGTGARKLPKYIRVQLDQKNDAMLDMYEAMMAYTRGSQMDVIQEGLSFPKCMYVVLSGAFFAGREYLLTLETSDEDGNFNFEEEDDVPYDSETYNQKFQLSDYQATTNRSN